MRSSSSSSSPRVLIVAEDASSQFGGEAMLPLHYFRRLRARGIETWLIVHARRQAELTSLLGPDIERVQFVPDAPLHKALFRLGSPLPHAISHFTVQRVMRLHAQMLARRLARVLIEEHQIDVVHQPTPVSPKESSLLFDLGVPVVMGPMNGGMDFPPGFRRLQQSRVEKTIIHTGRRLTRLTHPLLPGKLQAATLLVANQRTRDALPQGVQGKVAVLVENGVDTELWQRPPARAENATVRFAAMARLVSWKAIDLLLHAFARLRQKRSAELHIIGDGVERASLERLTQDLGIAADVRFWGWVPQSACPPLLMAADVFVLPSLQEAGGAVVLEAMALQLPVIATRWGGPTDYLDDSCGIMIDPTTPKDLIDGFAEAMDKLAGDAALRKQLGAAGREKIEREFTWDKKIDAILAHYADAQERTAG